MFSAFVLVLFAQLIISELLIGVTVSSGIWETESLSQTPSPQGLVGQQLWERYRTPPTPGGGGETAPTRIP